MNGQNLIGWVAFGLAVYGVVLAHRQLAVETPTNAAAAASRRDLARRLGVAETDVEVVGVHPMEWADASLGLPEPGMQYAQVITPGYHVVLRAAGLPYEYHSTLDGSTVRLCQPCTQRMQASGTMGG